ncbi:MAG: hypothetical protein MR773_00025 [Eubacterium coprostanoligenes]|nr:hypothetical protein [Eubacterium coprostanoligenes]
MLSKFILKYENKAIFLIGGFIILALAIMLIVMFSNTGEKTPVTCEELNTKLIDMGYEPADTTYAYSDQNANLIRSIAIDTGKIRFDFFEFDNDNSALSLFKNSQAKINQKRNANSQDWTAHYNNYVMYSTQSDGIYYIVIRVGNTTIYAYCDAEYKSELDTILLSIDYGSLTKNK